MPSRPPSGTAGGRRAARAFFPALLAILALPVLSAPAAAQPTLLFGAAPSGEVLQDSLVTLGVAPLPGRPMPAECGVFRSAVPAGDRLEGHGARIPAEDAAAPGTAGRVFRFRPSDTAQGGVPILGLGFHYLVVACGDGADVTPEIPLLVVSRRAPAILAPKALETSASPAIAWTPVPGVPAYHLLLSDQALEIDAAKGTVGGASVIWQAITTGTSIAYGTPDPSGTFTRQAAPPLSPGVAYNLVVLNNYDGKSALATSSKAQALKLFSIQAPAVPLSKPKNLAPAPDSRLNVLSDTAITLRWSASRAGSAPANTYKPYIYSLEEEGGSEILVPIWSTEVTDTVATLDARRTLLSKRYVWKVFALGDAGAGVVGDTTSFAYRNDVQTLSLAVKGPSGPLSDVRIRITPLDGGADPIPVFTPSGGEVERTLAVGDYLLEFGKDGYTTRTRTVTLASDAPLVLEVTLSAAAGRIRGRATDAGGLGLDNVEVSAASGDAEVAARTDAQGWFLLGVGAGTHAVGFRKADHLSPEDTLVTVKAGETVDIGRRILVQAQGALSGTVANDKGVPMAACQVTVKTAAGSVARTLLTDDRGAFSALLPPGSYTVVAARTGFAAEEKSVRLADAAVLAFRLAPGASVIKGTLSARARPAPATSVSAPLAGAALELVEVFSGAVFRATSDLRGEFTFSADTGTYLLRASAPGRARPDSALVRVDRPRATVLRDLGLEALASVRGSIVLEPAAPVDPDSVTVALLRLPALEPAATARAVRIPGSASLAFSLEGVPDGDYRLSCGLPGYGLRSEPAVAVREGVWVTGLSLLLERASKSVAFSLRHGTGNVPGTVRLASPLRADLAAGAEFGPAAPGTYVLSAAPDSLALLPLARFAFSLPGSGAADTAVELPLPFSHDVPGAPLEFEGGTVALALKTRVQPDSAWVIYGYGAPTDTFRVPRDQLRTPSPGDPKIIRFDPGARGGLLTYAFIVRAGGLAWSNAAPDRRFRAEVAASRALAHLRVSAGDSLPLPERSKVPLTVHAYDAAGRRLDSAVDARGRVLWRQAGLAAKVESRRGRALTLATGEAPRPAAAKAAASAGSGAWDTLEVSVVLDGDSLSLSVPAKVLPARVNRLVLSSTLGETPAIPSPADFALLAEGFDTTTSPPTPLVPAPAYALDPPEAGTVEEGRVRLHPRFIGPLRITAVHANGDGSRAATELGAGRDSLLRGLNVGQTLRPGDTARLLVHDRQFEMRVPDSALAGGEQAVVRVFRRTLAKSFASGVREAVSGRLHEVSNPSGAAFAKPLRLNLGIPAPFRGREHALRRFETADLEWADPGDGGDTGTADTTAFGEPSLSASVTVLDGSWYGLLGRSRPLSAGDLEIVPNPFSPLVTAVRDGNTLPGTRIRFRPESDRSAEVTVSVRIYNMDGELVRILADHKTVPKAMTEFYWDGKVDGGRWARNGRYLVKISLGAAGARGTRHIARPVVVFR